MRYWVACPMARLNWCAIRRTWMRNSGQLERGLQQSRQVELAALQTLPSILSESGFPAQLIDFGQLSLDTAHR